MRGEGLIVGLSPAITRVRTKAMYVDPQTRMTQEQIEQQAREYAADDICTYGYWLPNAPDDYAAPGSRTHAIFKAAYNSVTRAQVIADHAAAGEEVRS